MLFRHGSVQRGDAVPVRINGRVSKLRRDAQLELFRDEVFQPLRLVMEFFKRIAKFLEQEGLQQAMVTDYLQRPPAAVLGERSAAVPLVLEQRCRSCRELLDHVCYRRVRNSKPVRNGTAAHTFTCTAQVEDHLQVVINRLRVGL